MFRFDSNNDTKKANDFFPMLLFYAHKKKTLCVL